MPAFLGWVIELATFGALMCVPAVVAKCAVTLVVFFARLLVKFVDFAIQVINSGCKGGGRCNRSDLFCVQSEIDSSPVQCVFVFDFVPESFVIIIDFVPFTVSCKFLN